MAVVRAPDLESLMPLLRSVRTDTLVVDYDEEGDVLYISFQEPNIAESTDPIDKEQLDVLQRVDRHGQIIGYTILNASHHGYVT